MSGAGTAARRMNLSTQAGAQLFGLLTGQPSPGSPAASLDLGDLRGKGAHEAIEKIVDLLASTGTQDDQVIRSGMAEALSRCLEESESFDPDSLDTDMIADLFQTYMTEEIVLRLQLDAGKRTFEKEEDPVKLIQREKELRDYVGSVVDAEAGGELRNNLGALSVDKFQGLLGRLFQKVFESFERED